jgi:hypothetical protein
MIVIGVLALGAVVAISALLWYWSRRR